MRTGACIALLLCAVLSAPLSMAQDDADAVAKAMVVRFVDSWNREDGPAFGEIYWPDAELVDPSGVILTGRAAIVKAHIDLWSTLFRGTRQKVTIRRVKVLCPNHVVVDFDADLSGVSGPPPGATAAPGGLIKAHLKDIMEKRGGRWKILYSQNTLIARSR